MSREAVYEVFKKADQDAELKRKLEEALAKDEGAVAAFLATAAETGCEFTADEFVQARETERAEDAPRELSDAEMEGVAAGGRSVAASLFSRFPRRGPSIRQVGPSGAGEMFMTQDVLDS